MSKQYQYQQLQYFYQSYEPQYMRIPLLVQNEAREILKYYYKLQDINTSKLLAYSLYDYSKIHPEIFKFISFKSQYDSTRIKQWCYQHINISNIETDSETTK